MLDVLLYRPGSSSGTLDAELAAGFVRRLLGSLGDPRNGTFYLTQMCGT